MTKEHVDISTREWSSSVEIHATLCGNTVKEEVKRGLFFEWRYRRALDRAVRRVMETVKREKSWVANG